MHRSLDYMGFIAAGLGIVLALLALSTAILGPLAPWALVIAAILILGGLIGLSIEAARPLAKLRSAITGQLHSIDGWLERPRLVRTMPRVTVPPQPGERGFLDYERDWGRAIGASTKLMEKIGQEMGRNTGRVTRDAGRLAAAKGAPIKTRIRRAQESARTLKKHADRLEVLEVQFARNIKVMSENYMALLANPTTRQAVSIPGPLTTMRAGSIASRQSTNTYRSTVLEMRKISVEQTVNQQSDRLASVLGKLSDDMGSVVTFCDQALATIRGNGPSSAKSKRRSRR